MGWTFLEKKTIEGDSPVNEIWKDVQVSWVLLIGYWVRNWEASTPNLKYVLSPIADSTVRERWKELLAES